MFELDNSFYGAANLGVSGAPRYNAFCRDMQQCIREIAEEHQATQLAPTRDLSLCFTDTVCPDPYGGPEYTLSLRYPSSFPVSRFSFWQEDGRQVTSVKYKFVKDRALECTIHSINPSSRWSRHSSNRIEILNGRYLMTGHRLGCGSDGTVLQALDIREQWRAVAIKINVISSGDREAQSSKALLTRINVPEREWTLLTYLYRSDSLMRVLLTDARNFFDIDPRHRLSALVGEAVECDDGAKCSGLVMQKMDGDLSTLLQSRLRLRPESPFSPTEVRWVAHQILFSLKRLSEMTGQDGEKAPVIHADIKVENILYGARFPTGIKVADLGRTQICRGDGSTPWFLGQCMHNRAPEVVLRQPLTPSVDIWSVGCLLYLLYTGSSLFPAESEAELLALQMSYAGGEFPNSFVERSPKDCFDMYFDRDERLMRYTIKPEYALEHNKSYTEEQSLKLSSFIKINNGWWTPKECSDFMDLLETLLTVDPKHRISAGQALDHPFF